MPPQILLTRPEPASHRFAAEIARFALPVTISPILRIAEVPHDQARLDAATGLVFTSENAVPFAGNGRGRPAICVGPRSARVAAEAGFDAVAGPGDAERLMPMVTGLGADWLHPHGTHVAKVLPVQGMVVYDQVVVPLTAAAEALLRGEAPVILPLFSPRSARLLALAAREATAPLWIAPISEAASLAWDAPAARRIVAVTPDAPGIIGAMERLLDERHSISPG